MVYILPMEILCVCVCVCVCVCRTEGYTDLADRLVELQYELTDRLTFYICGRKPGEIHGFYFLCQSGEIHGFYFLCQSGEIHGFYFLCQSGEIHGFYFLCQSGEIHGFYFLCQSVVCVLLAAVC